MNRTISLWQMCRLLLGSLLVFACAFGLSAQARANTYVEAEPDNTVPVSRRGRAHPVAPIGSTPAGQTYGHWAAAFWQWVLGVPHNNYSAQSKRQRVNPLKDTTGAHCAEHQIGDVWFLAGSWVGSVNRSCTIPAGRSLFFPLINNVYVGFLTDPPAQRTEQWARDQAACTEPAVISVSIGRRRSQQSNFLFHWTFREPVPCLQYSDAIRSCSGRAWQPVGIARL